MKRILVSMSIGLGLALAAAPLRADEGKEDEAKEHAAARKNVMAAKTTMLDAIKTALKKVPGKAVEAKLEKEHGTLIYEVEIANGDKHTEVEIDATTGHVAKVEDEHGEKTTEGKREKGEDAESAAANGATNFVEAVEAAQQRLPDGKPFEVKPEKEKGKLIFEVEMVSGKKVMEVEVDAATGKVIDVDEEGE